MKDSASRIIAVGLIAAAQSLPKYQLDGDLRLNVRTGELCLRDLSQKDEEGNYLATRKREYSWILCGGADEKKRRTQGAEEK
jgi:hypothetical protein